MSMTEEVKAAGQDQFPGYRPQDQDPAKVDLFRKNKYREEAILRVLDAMKADPSIDPRWLAIGRTYIEQGFMAINRAVFQPERVKLAGE